MNKIKRKKNYEIQVELDQLEKLVLLIVEKDDLLEQLEAKSIEDFEKKINKLTGFTNATVSANAYGFETEYKRLLKLEMLIDGKLSSKDLTSEKCLKRSVISGAIDKHTEYYTPGELTTKKALEKLMQEFNKLSTENRQHIGFNRNSELAWTMYSELRF